MDLALTLLNPYGVAYLVLVLIGQLIFTWYCGRRRRRIADRRARQGLPADIMIDHHDRLAATRKETLSQATLLLASGVGLPFILMALPGVPWEAMQGLAIAFAALFVWTLVVGTDVARAFLGGLAFRTIAAMTRPFQVGDRVNLRGVSGRVVEIGLFFVKLQTPDDDLVSLPTSSLWAEVLSSANAGERYSLAVVTFYLSPTATSAQREAAETALVDAIQASTYFDMARPVKLSWQQDLFALTLTARCYVALTYNDPAFRSDITRVFLNRADELALPLSAPARAPTLWPAAQAA
ncbi:MAG: mechanosensitive ion channel domain-containing protein [Geminicoccaceae bacterium]